MNYKVFLQQLVDNYNGEYKSSVEVTEAKVSGMHDPMIPIGAIITDQDKSIYHVILGKRIGIANGKKPTTDFIRTSSDVSFEDAYKKLFNLMITKSLL